MLCWLEADGQIALAGREPVKDGRAMGHEATEVTKWKERERERERLASFERDPGETFKLDELAFGVLNMVSRFQGPRPMS